MLGSDWPVKCVAASEGIARATAYRWLDKALRYDDPEAEALRRLAEVRERAQHEVLGRALAEIN